MKKIVYLCMEITIFQIDMAIVEFSAKSLPNYDWNTHSQL